MNVLLLALSALYFYQAPFRATLSKEELVKCRQNTFATHETKTFSLCHQFNEKCALLPLRFFLRMQAYTVQPFPAQEASSFECYLKKGASALLMGLSFFPATSSLLVSSLIRALEHKGRPFLSYLYTENEGQKIALTKDVPLHVATYNVGLTPESLNIKMDLRPPKMRSLEIASSLLSDNFRPDILIIEEGWHEEALKILCTHLSAIYPHIIYNVAPSLSGFSSGIALFSRYPLEEVEFLAFEKMLFLDALPPRGVLRLVFQTEKGPLTIFGGVHMQAYDTKESQHAREHQLKQLVTFMQERSSPMQIVMGDFNFEKPDEALLFHENFDDLFLRDHALTGERIADDPFFLSHDNARMKKAFSEPCGTWCASPNTRYDYIAIPKKSSLDGRVEIRRMESEASDHLPVHALIYCTTSTNS